MKDHPSRLPWRSGHTEYVEATLDHFMRGHPGSGCRCVVALAVSEHFAQKFPGTRWEATVSDHGVTVYECDSGDDQWYYAHDAAALIHHYDGMEANGLHTLPEHLNPIWGANTRTPVLIRLGT